MTAKLGVNVRAGPANNRPVLYKIAHGKEVLFLEIHQNGTWAKIELDNGKIGWISAEYLSAVKSILGPGGIWLV